MIRYIAVFSIFLLLCYPLGMADPVWGMLAKDQTDPTTIDTAIAAAIAAHDADASAHTATGASLDLHRNNGIIDHPAGSIVSDKFSAFDCTFNNNFFNDLSLYSPTGSTTLSNGYLSTFLFHAVGGFNDATIPIPGFQLEHFPANDVVIDWIGVFDWSASSISGGFIVGDPGGSPSAAFGLRINSGNLQLFTKSGGSTNSVNVTYTHGTKSRFRLFVDSVNNKLNLFIDGTFSAQVSLLTYTSPDLSAGIYLFSDSGLTTYSEVGVSVLNVGYPLDLI